MAGKLEKQKAKRGLKVLINYALKNKRTIIVIALLNIVASILNGASPYISGKLFDSILSDGSLVFFNFNPIPIWAAMLLLWFFIQLAIRALGWWNERRQEMFLTIITDNYQLDGVKKLISLPLEFHKKYKKGDVVNRINNASGRLGSALSIFFDIAPQIFSIFFGLFFVFIIHYVFGIVMVVSITVFIVAILLIKRKQGEFRKKAQKYSIESNGDLFDAIENIKVVKQHGSEDYEYNRFYSKSINKSQFYWIKVISISANMDLAQRLIILSAQIIIFIISIGFIRSGNMTLGELFAVNGYSAMSFGPIATFIRWYNWLNNCLVSVESAEKIFGEKSEKYNIEKLANKDYIDGNIEFKNVFFYYKEGNSKKSKTKDILKNVSFMIKKGETVAIVGESGVGKTTIADLISGFYFPQKGQILVDNIPTQKIPLQFLRKNVAVVSQDITIFNESIKYNIKYGNFNIDDNQVFEAAREAGAHEFISKFKKKYNQKVGERGIKLSGGQRQRVTIAQAIINKAPILILDEPTSALDARTEKIVTESLEKLMEGKTTIIIAHRLSTVKKADKIIVLDKGRVAEIGKHKDLIKKKDGVYRKFYEVQKL
uniref:ABC transporter ATP-binding protein n=1 Tax=candidate division CPR3 bacterium TaxID=2268181 RepID=A0A7C4R2K3_UNCC3